MKILNINAVYGFRSTGVIVKDIHHFLMDQGIDSYVGYSRGVHDKNTIKIGSLFDRKIHSILSRLSGLQGYFSYLTTKRFISKINQINPDIIHLHNMHDNYFNIGLLFEYLVHNHKTLVITLHDCWFFTGKCTHFAVDKCMKWTEKCGACPRLKKDNPSWIFDRTRKSLNDKAAAYKEISNVGVIGVSDWITKSASISILKDSRMIKRIYNWVDITSYKMILKKDNPLIKSYGDKIIILGVSSFWSNSKGLDKFIELANVINEDFLIILIGNIDIKYLPTNIVNVKEIKNDSVLMSKYYSLATVTVSFSLEESFGKTSIESMVCGTPIIVQNSTASPELVGYNCGYVVENQSINQTKQFIDEIVLNGKDSYSNDCIKFTKENFDKEKILKEHLHFYNEMLLVK